MKLVITASTAAEIQPVADYLKQYGDAAAVDIFHYGGNEIHLCITGVGILPTTYVLTRLFAAHKFDFAIQAGVAGSFDGDLDLAQLVLVQSEVWGDIGAEDHDTFLDIFSLGLADPDHPPFSNGRLECPLSLIPFPYRLLTVSGLTVNTASGSAATIRKRIERHNCQVESMEGAAFHYVCLREQVPFAQIRAISNYVTPRNRNEWSLPEAIAALNQWLTEFLNNELNPGYYSR